MQDVPCLHTLRRWCSGKGEKWMVLEKSKRYNEQKEGLDEDEGQALSSSAQLAELWYHCQETQEGKSCRVEE